MSFFLDHMLSLHFCTFVFVFFFCNFQICFITTSNYNIGSKKLKALAISNPIPFDAAEIKHFYF